MKTFRQLTAGLALASCFGSANAYINIVFDYTYDTTNFFTADRRATLEQAATVFETRVFDTLNAITSTPAGNSISLNLSDTRIENANIAKNELRIYVNSASSIGATAREATPIKAQQGGMGVKGDSSYLNAAWSRGQTGWPESEVGTWGGEIYYNNTVSWYADSDVSTVESFAGQWDLYTATLKGMVEIMGVSNNGVDEVYPRKLNGVGNFNGDKAKIEYDVVNSRGILQAIPTEKVLSANTRLAANIKGDLLNGQEQLALLAWGLSTGERRYMTELDWAIMDDIGWDVTGFTVMPETPPVPEPQTWAMLAAGLGLIGYTARKRRMM